MNPMTTPSLHVIEHEQNKNHPLHKMLHLPGSDKQIYSPGVVEQLPTAWRAMHWTDLHADYTADHYDDRSAAYVRTTFFLRDRNVSALKRVLLYLSLPEIRVKEKYRDSLRIAWTENMAFAVIQEVSVDTGGARPYQYSKHAMRVAATVACKHTTEMCELEYDVGNRAELIQWTNTRLDGTQVGFFQPFFFSQLESGLICYTTKPICFEYDFDLRTSELLRCERLGEGGWVTTAVDPEYFEALPHRLQMPRLTGQFFYNSKFADAKLFVGSLQTYFFTDIVEIAAQNPTDCRQIMEITLDKDVLVKAVFVIVENTTGHALNKMSCLYSSDVSELKVDYDRLVRMSSRNNPLLSRMISKCHLGIQLPAWLHMFSWCENPLDIMESDIAFHLLKGKITVHMRQRADDTSLYRYRAFFLVQRIITYEAVVKRAEATGESPAVQFKVTIT